MPSPPLHPILSHTKYQLFRCDPIALSLQQKLAVGAKPDDILRKELSLAGYQRPLDPATLPDSARTFFQVGEFVGWILAAPER